MVYGWSIAREIGDACLWRPHGCQFLKNPWRSGKKTLGDLSQSVHSCSKNIQLQGELWRNFVKKCPQNKHPHQTNSSLQCGVSWKISGLECFSYFATKAICVFFRRVHFIIFFFFFVGFLGIIRKIKYQIKHPLDFRWVSWYSTFCLFLQSHTSGLPYNTSLSISSVCWGLFLEDTNNYTLLFTTSVCKQKNYVFCMISSAAVNNVRCLLRNSYKFWLNLHQHILECINVLLEELSAVWVLMV